MAKNEDLQTKVTGFLLPMTQKPEMVEALKLFDITITLPLDDESKGAEISFLGRGDLKKFIRGTF